MAIARGDVYQRTHALEAYCKAEWEEARYRGDNRRADEIHDYFQQRKREIEMGEYDNYIGNASQMNNTINNLGGLGNIGGLVNSSNTGVQLQNLMTEAVERLAKSDFKPEFGVLYMHNAEMPGDWAGAKITDYKRTSDGKRWHIAFSSKWDKSLDIRLYLDIEELNGTEVNAMAATYMETLNQRRVG